MDKRKKWRRALWLILGLVVFAAAVWLGVRYYLISASQAPKAAYDPGTWIELKPEGIVSANAEPVYTEMRLGAENKVLVFFYGGGLSVNEFTADRPYTGAAFVVDENGFYTADIDGMIPDYCQLGLGAEGRQNPFRDWSVVIVPYATGDFHLGTADYAYTAADGSRKVLRHHGYTNYRAILDEAMAYLPEDPEELLVAGYSAGGFGAAALAGDVYENYFPGAAHVTVCIDSSLLKWRGFPETVREVWGAPEEVSARFVSDDPILDLMTALYEDYGDAWTYLYIGTVRDGELARYQNFFSTGRYLVSNVNGRIFTADLRETLFEMKRRIPGLGVYLIDGLPFSLRPYQMALTQHTVTVTPMLFWPLTNRVSPAAWLMQSVRGNVRDHGMMYLG